MQWSWYKAFNITGTVHCGERTYEYHDLLRSFLGTADDGRIFHTTGEITICLASPIACVMSSGLDVQRLIAYVLGEYEAWQGFGLRLEAALKEHHYQCSFKIHEWVMSDNAGRIVPAKQNDDLRDFEYYMPPKES